MPLDNTGRGHEAWQAVTTGLWEEALATGNVHALLRPNGHHFTGFPRFAPAFADLKRELRFSDLPEPAQLAFLCEALTTLRNEGQEAGCLYCRRATLQLEGDYASRRGGCRA